MWDPNSLTRGLNPCLLQWKCGWPSNENIFNTLMQPMFTDHLLLAPVMRTVHRKSSKMHKKASLCGGYRYGEGAEDGGKDRKITKEIKRIFPVMMKLLWGKKKTNQTQQGDRLGDFLFCSSMREEGKV